LRLCRRTCPSAQPGYVTSPGSFTAVFANLFHHAIDVIVAHWFETMFLQKLGFLFMLAFSVAPLLVVLRRLKLFVSSHNCGEC
jgi:hypothetical protein